MGKDRRGVARTQSEAFVCQREDVPFADLQAFPPKLSQWDDAVHTILGSPVFTSYIPTITGREASLSYALSVYRSTSVAPSA